jgi:hypothetical protein
VGLDEDVEPEQYACPSCQKHAPSSEVVRRNTEKGAFSDRLGAGATLSLTMAAIQACCPVMDKLKTLQKNIRERPSEEHIHHLKGKLAKLLTADSQSSDEDVDTTVSVSVQQLIGPYGISSLISEWIQLAEDSRKRTNKWSDNAQKLISEACERVIGVIQASSMFKAAIDPSAAGLKNACRTSHETCDACREDVHALAVRPDSLELFDSELRVLSNLTAASAKLNKILSETATASREQDEKINQELLDWKKSIEMIDDAAPKPAGSANTKLQCRVLLLAFRKNFDKCYAPVQAVFRVAMQLNLQPKSITLTIVKAVLSMLTPGVHLEMHIVISVDALATQMQICLRPLLHLNY